MPSEERANVSVTQSGDMTSAFASALESASSTPVAEASPASTPTTDGQPTENASAAAIAQPEAQPTAAVTASPDSQQPAKGEPPAWRWQDILENTRKSVAEETAARVRQEVEQQYSWAKDISASEQERANLINWYRKLNADPVSAFRELQQAIEAHPQYAAALKPQQADPEPEPDLQTADGQFVYSASQQKAWQEWNTRRISTELRKEFQQELQPLKQTHQTLQSQQASAAYNDSVASVIARMSEADPKFKEHRKDVFEVIQSDPKLLDRAIGTADSAPDPETAIEIAWGRVHRSKVLPTLQQTTQSQVLADLQQRATASTVNPGAPSVTSPKKFQPGVQGFQEALTHFSGTGR